jgi:hypothetical protein
MSYSKQRNKYALNPKNKGGLDNKWQHAGKKSANKLVDDGTGKGTMVKASALLANKLVDDGTGKGTMVRSCVKAANTVKANCITCNMVPRTTKSDKCNQCQLAHFLGNISGSGHPLLAGTL